MIQPVPTSATAAGGQANPQQQAKLKSAAQAFEAVFLRQMIGSMRQASLGDGMFDSDASDQFRDMADAKLADNMAHKGVLGIANMLVKQLGPVAAQEKAGAQVAGQANAAPDTADAVGTIGSIGTPGGDA